MFSIIKKGIATFRSKGIKETFYWFYFGYLKVNKFFLFRRELDQPFPEVTQRDGIRIEQISLQQLKEIRQNSSKASRGILLRYLRRGKDLFCWICR